MELGFLEGRMKETSLSATMLHDDVFGPEKNKDHHKPNLESQK